MGGGGREGGKRVGCFKFGSPTLLLRRGAWLGLYHNKGADPRMILALKNRILGAIKN